MNYAKCGDNWPKFEGGVAKNRWCNDTFYNIFWWTHDKFRAPGSMIWEWEKNILNSMFYVVWI